MKHAAWALLALAPVAAAAAATPGRGIPEALATERAANIRAPRYELAFRVPESKAEPLRGMETARFQLGAPRQVVLDFEQPRERILSVAAGGEAVAFEFVDGHIVVPAAATRAGENAIRIEFLAGDESLNRNDEFLYTLFVPARAHYAFPCFDQPSLKARYALTLDIPALWQVTANGAETGRDTANGRAVVRFAETEPLPTYLFAFAAGKFQVETAERNGRTFRMFHRETDAAKVARNRDAIFDLHARALTWLEEYTAIRYPWGKFDFVLIPSFQFGGMEHAGAILYNASGLMLDPSATQNQLLGRASVIAHETAHMWFGDLVTMRWFNDVWMKEVLANFMAAKIVNPSFPEINHELRFLLAHYPAAYEVDRTAGSNPIRQELANLDEAGSLYGPIIYDKAPIVMRQLEMIAGERGFRDGMREYLKRHSFGNATWLDLVNILEARNQGKVANWSRAWVEQRGRPEIATELRVGADGKIASLALQQRDPMGRSLVWPQRLQVAVGEPGGVRQFDVAMGGATVSVEAARGMERPLWVIPNGGGLGYGLFKLDDTTLRYLLNHLEEIGDPLTRGSAWVDLWENLLEARVKPAELLDLAARALPRETDEQNTQRILSYVTRAFWHEIPASERAARAPSIEALLRDGLAKAPTASRKSAWFNAFREAALTGDGLAWLERVWRREEKVPGLTFAETDEIDMALNLAVREIPGWRQILTAQRDRTQNPDRRARFEFVMPALSAEATVREQAFARLRDASNRRHEPWVLESLRYLNHPLREAHARRFVRPALDLLPEIQKTGDIFFPKRWMDSTLGGHRSAEAEATVREYLAAHPELPERLRWVVLNAADDLFRAAKRPLDWRGDLEYFAREFGAHRVDLKKSYPAFESDIAALQADLPKLADAEIVARLMRIVAAGRDGHTTVQLPIFKLGMRQLPLSTRWYSDGLFVVGATPRYEAALGARIVKIGPLTAEAALAAVAPYVAHENEASLREFSAGPIQTIELLRLIGAADPGGTVTLALAKSGGEPFAMAVAPEPRARQISMYDALHLPAGLSRKHPTTLYWSEYLPESRAVYIQYNQCRNDPNLPFSSFARSVFETLDSNPVERVVIDLRFNPGGNSMVIAPLKSGLRSRKLPVYVLIGPGTFSSAQDNAIEMRQELRAILVGEPTGERPNGYGEVRQMTLPSSGLEIRYSTRYFHMIQDADPEALEPDIAAPRSFADVVAGRDRALEAALRR